MEDRKTILLKACMELLKRQDESGCLLNLIDEEVFYDNANCDGACLLEDIKLELGIED